VPHSWFSTRRPSVRLVTLAVSAALVLAGCSLASAPTRPAGSGSSADRGGPVAPAPPTTTGPAAPSGYFSRSGTQLVVNGQVAPIVSVNDYELATNYGTNYGCGAMLDDSALDSFFASLPAGATVRIWGMQGSMAINPTTRTVDWGPLDRVVSAAGAHGDHLIVSLDAQQGNCDEGFWKDLSWYQGGYRTETGTGLLSYWNWVHQIVPRYASSPAIAMWELVNEPEAADCAAGYTESNCYGHLSCPDEATAEAAMRSFFDTVGTEIKRLDPNHLVESGTAGGGQCGLQGNDFSAAQAGPGIDVTSFHDYEAGTLPADLSERLAESRTLDKPLLVGELGVTGAANTSGCPSLPARATQLQSTVSAALSAGAAGVLFWDWVPVPQTSLCTLDIGPGDPALSLLRGTPPAG